MKTTAIGRIAALTILFATAGESRDARADAMTSYTFTDLGPTTSYSTDADGNRVVVASAGQKYTFPGSSGQSWSADSLAKMGAPTPNYDSNPNFDGFSKLDTYGITSNQNGYFIGSAVIVPQNNYYIRWGHHYTTNELYSFQKMPDGSFGPAKVLDEQLVYISDAQMHRSQALSNVIGLNKNNVALASIASSSGPGTNYLLFDLKTGNSTMLFPGYSQPLTNPSAAVGIGLNQPLAIDDQGRILYDANRYNPMTKTVEDDKVLLTPAGLSTDPIPTPEPTALVTLGVAAVGLLIHRHRRALKGVRTTNRGN